MQCIRGCGQEATHYSIRLKKWFCFRAASKCPLIQSAMSNKLKVTFADPTKHPCYGRILSEDTKKKIGENSGKTRRANPVRRTQEQKDHASKLITEQWSDGRRSKDTAAERAKTISKRRKSYSVWNKGVKTGQVPWNKGLRKQESLEILSREDPAYSNFRKYRNRVAVRTKKTYMQYKDEINPNNLPLGKCGIDGVHQIDHIITVRKGFEQGIAIEEISAKENLQVIPWLENVQKYDGKGLRGKQQKDTI